MRVLIFLSLIVSCNVSAQGLFPAGARSMSMANASTTLIDVWGYHNNPGALAEVKEFNVGLSYENRFLLKELQSQALAVAIPLKVGVLSVGGHQYGYTQFRSLKAGLGYSMKLSEKLSAGVQMNYQGLILSENYGSKNTASVEAGVFARITEEWKLGVAVFNLGRAQLSEFEDDRFTTTVRLGTSYDFSKKVLVSVELEKDIDYPMRLKSGVEYEAIDHFYIRGGIASNPVDLTFGFGYAFKKIQLDLGSAYDRNLGWSPHFSIIFQAK